MRMSRFSLVGVVLVVGCGDQAYSPGRVVGPAPMDMPANAGDRHTAPGTNPFVSTQHNPFSTFAADVDTASYDLFRRDVQQNMVPRPEGVRLEEYVNYFAYEYPAPAPGAAHPFQI